MTRSLTFFFFVIPILASANPLSGRTYTFKTGGNDFSCSQGVPNNGHNYPVPTQITFDTEYGASGIYYPSKLPLNNTQSVTFTDPAAKPCSAYADLLMAPSYSLNGRAVQKFSESSRMTVEGECFKWIREDLTITVGKYTLTGSSVFTQPMASSDCP